MSTIDNSVSTRLPLDNEELRARLNMIIQNVPKFWEQSPYRHFTNHGPAHSERILNQKLAQLAQELPQDRRLTPDEVFIVSASAWLYEIGMQSPRLKPLLEFENIPGTPLSFTQLHQIRANKHLLSEKLIVDSVRSDYDGPPLQLGLTTPADEYTRLIAMVCRGCSDEPLDQFLATLPVSGVPVRVRLLVALLRLADQLYIDTSRVNLDLLQNAGLPNDKLAKWWSYHYAQTLPVVNNQIPFHYFLPTTQRELLGHIRAIVEGGFERDKNPVIRFLFENGLPLIPGENSTIQLDQPDGFLREMSRNMVTYLRDHIAPKAIYGFEPPPPPPSVLNTLLVLDYENFLLQLGDEGHFFDKEEIRSLIIDLLRTARSQTGGMVRGLAVGHWDREDLLEVSTILKPPLYDRLNINDNMSVPEALTQNLQQRFQGGDGLGQLILVTPREEFADLANRVQSENKCSVITWISHSPDSAIYEIISTKFEYVNTILCLAQPSTSDSVTLESQQASCVLRLTDKMLEHPAGLTVSQIRKLFEEIEAIKGQSNWWFLRLTNLKIVVPSDNDRSDYYVINNDHPAVKTVYEMRDLIIRSLESLSSKNEGVSQNSLVVGLRQTFHSLVDKQVIDFLEFLKVEELIHRRQNQYSPDNPVWSLNPWHRSVITLNAERYLSLFSLAFDHAVVNSEYPNLLEHMLLRSLSHHFGRNTVELVGDLAIRSGWLHRRDSSEQRRDGRGSVTYLRLADDHTEVGTVLRNRDILLNILYHKSARQGLSREALWQRLRNIRSFTLSDSELEWWLGLLERDAIVERTFIDDVPGQIAIKLNLETSLTQRLLGRLNICGLVRNLRIMQATAPDRAKPTSEILEKLTKFVTDNDRSKAQWTLEYGRVMKLIQSDENSLFLNSQHGFIRKLDSRERTACVALVQLVKSLAHMDKDGWVPCYVVLQKMDDDMQYGYARGEHEYWLEQAVFRVKLLEKTRGNDRQEIVRVRKDR